MIKVEPWMDADSGDATVDEYEDADGFELDELGNLHVTNGGDDVAVYREWLRAWIEELAN